LKKIYYNTFAVGNLIKFRDEESENLGLIIGRPVGRPGRYLFEDDRGSGFHFNEDDDYLTLAIPVLYRYQRYNIPIRSIILDDNE
tara:strand:+ start:8243 stop:8497 length:255 start_codon:yes stop_codon:yes gene_type:complete